MYRQPKSFHVSQSLCISVYIYLSYLTTGMAGSIFILYPIHLPWFLSFHVRRVGICAFLCKIQHQYIKRNELIKISAIQFHKGSWRLRQCPTTCTAWKETRERAFYITFLSLFLFSHSFLEGFAYAR